MQLTIEKNVRRGPPGAGRRRALMWLAALAAGISSPAWVHAVEKGDTYPDKPMHLIVSYPPGGSVDLAARIMGKSLARTLGQQVLIENKGGAGGTIATDFVAKSRPDGYTLLITASSHTINPAIYANLPFDTEKDFASISLIASAPQILVAHPSFPASTLAELVSHAKNSKTEIPYGSGGAGSPGHMAGELFRSKTRLALLHVPYRGGGPATVDLLGGQIPLLWISLPAVMQYVKEGRLKALAVSTRTRSPLLPEVPSVAETIKGFNVDTWYAIFAPANTPQNIVNKIQSAVTIAAKDKEIQDAFLTQGAVVVGGPPSELDAVIKSEVPMWKALAKDAGIRAN